MDLEGLLRSSRELAEGQLKKQEDIIEGLRGEVEKECTLSGQLRGMLKDLEEGSAAAKDIGLIAVRRYTGVVKDFGGITRELPEEPGVSDVMKWFAHSSSTLKEFVFRAGDFATLSRVTNLLSTMDRKGCRHLDDFSKKNFAFLSPAELGEPSKAVKHAGHRFMQDFFHSHG